MQTNFNAAKFDHFLSATDTIKTRVSQNKTPRIKSSRQRKLFPLAIAWLLINRLLEVKLSLLKVLLSRWRRFHKQGRAVVGRLAGCPIYVGMQIIHFTHDVCAVCLARGSFLLELRVQQLSLAINFKGTIGSSVNSLVQGSGVTFVNVAKKSILTIFTSFPSTNFESSNKAFLRSASCCKKDQ